MAYIVVVSFSLVFEWEQSVLLLTIDHETIWRGWRGNEVIHSFPNW